MAGYYRWYNCALVLEYRAQSDTSVSDQPPPKENESVTHISSLMKYPVLKGLHINKTGSETGNNKTGKTGSAQWLIN